MGSGCLVVDAGEELVEQVGAVGLVVLGGVVVLALQGGSELDAGLEEGAGFADCLVRHRQVGQSQQHGRPSCRGGYVPTTTPLNLDDPDPECDLNHVRGDAVRATVDIALNNSFGFGGHNATLVFAAGKD